MVLYRNIVGVICKQGETVSKELRSYILNFNVVPYFKLFLSQVYYSIVHKFDGFSKVNVEAFINIY